MATIVCRGSQSCLESQIHEPRTIRLHLSCLVDEKRSHYDDEKKISSTADDDNSHCWSFLQAFSNNNSSKLETADTYVHPLDNRSKSTLSDKSLELCTENLGSETGTDIIEDSSRGGGSIFSWPSENGGNDISTRREQQKCVTKKVTARNFPPPLTTMRGVASLQVRPHREDGRLIIRATNAPSTHCSLFQAERSHGRLRLSLFKYSDAEEIENDIAAASCGDEEEEEEEGDAIEDEFDEENDGYMGEEEEEDEKENEKAEEEGVKGKNRDVGGEMGIKKFKRAGRCKDGEPEKKGLLNWEALWVATS